VSRVVPFDKEETCDVCGQKGAYDFMGDLICPKCADEFIEDEDDTDIPDLVA